MVMNSILSFISEHKDEIKSIITLIVFMILLVGCYGKWNDLWYDFGKNVYYFFHH